MAVTYRGTCRYCGDKRERTLHERWQGTGGTGAFAAECHVCGPGTDIVMRPDEDTTTARFGSFT